MLEDLCRRAAIDDQQVSRGMCNKRSHGWRSARIEPGWLVEGNTHITSYVRRYKLASARILRPAGINGAGRPLQAGRLRSQSTQRPYDDQLSSLANALRNSANAAAQASSVVYCWLCAMQSSSSQTLSC